MHLDANDVAMWVVSMVLRTFKFCHLVAHFYISVYMLLEAPPCADIYLHIVGKLACKLGQIAVDSAVLVGIGRVLT